MLAHDSPDCSEKPGAQKMCFFVGGKATIGALENHLKKPFFE
jgi:hypothetical protein